MLSADDILAALEYEKEEIEEAYYGARTQDDRKRLIGNLGSLYITMQKIEQLVRNHEGKN